MLIGQPLAAADDAEFNPFLTDAPGEPSGDEDADKG